MELKFNTIEELEEFVLKLGYVKLDENEKPIVPDSKPIIIEKCPYGHVVCPYHTDRILPYNPYSNPIVTFNGDTETTSKNGSITVDMKNIKNK